MSLQVICVWDVNEAIASGAHAHRVHALACVSKKALSGRIYKADSTNKELLSPAVRWRVTLIPHADLPQMEHLRTKSEHEPERSTLVIACQMHTPAMLS